LVGDRQRHLPERGWGDGGARPNGGASGGRPGRLLAALELPADLPRTTTVGGWTAVRVQDPAAGLVTVAVRPAPGGVRTLLAVAPATVAGAAAAKVVDPCSAGTAEQGEGGTSDQLEMLISEL
jgi:hypothetical protein